MTSSEPPAEDALPQGWPTSGPQVEFFQLYPDGPLPSAASGTALGALPSRAVQFCPPVVAASGFGWYLYPLADFALRWDGVEAEWARLGEDGEPQQWRTLAGGTWAYLAETEAMLASAPEHYRAQFPEALPDGYPFADANPRATNEIETDTGIIARTAPGWALLIRGVANAQWPSRDFQTLEGVIETAWYGGSLPVMVRLLAADRVVRFFRRMPYAVAQPVPVGAYDRRTLEDLRTERGIAELPQDVWDQFLAARTERAGSGLPGAYARRQRAYQRAAPPRVRGGD